MSAGSGSISAEFAGEQLHHEMAMLVHGRASRSSSSSSSSHRLDTFQCRLQEICDCNCEATVVGAKSVQGTWLWTSSFGATGKGSGLNPSDGIKAALSSLQSQPKEPSPVHKKPQGHPKQAELLRVSANTSACVHGTGRERGGDDFI